MYKLLTISLVSIFMFAGVAQADTIMDVDFGMWSGYTDVDDAYRAQDLSGNRYHGFLFGGAGALDTPIITGPTGGTGIDTTNRDTYVCLRDNQADGGDGGPHS